MADDAIETFLAGVPEPQRSTLEVVRARLRTALPGAEEAMAYGVPAFKIDGVGVAGYSWARKHCSYFPMSGSVLSTMGEAVAGFDHSKGTLRFPVDEPLSQELIDALVAARLQDITERAGH